MFDVVAIGEVLIDFIPSGLGDNGNPRLEMNPGGAPANVLAALSVLKHPTAFIGKVGRDEFGRFLTQAMESKGINTSGVVWTEHALTTLAFVHLSPSGERSFSFCRNPGADMLLSPEEVDDTLLGQSHWLHFGSVSMTHELSRAATMYAVRTAKERGVLISYDPNLRTALWKHPDEIRSVVMEAMKYVDMLKLSEEELQFLTHTDDPEAGSLILSDTYDIPNVFVTLGAKGCFYRTPFGTGQQDGYRVNAVDTTGAGDGFVGALLHCLLINDNTFKTSFEAAKAVSFANAAGALVTTCKGALSAMPTIDEINSLMNTSRGRK